MITQELVDKIIDGFQQGNTAKSIKESLKLEGFDEQDIESAMFHIRKKALSELPLIQYFSGLFKSWDEKAAHLPMSVSLGIVGLMGVVVLVTAFLLYNIVDPLSIKSKQRDRQRAEHLAQLQSAIGKYRMRNYSYPVSLDRLVPAYIRKVPNDPKNGSAYDYRIADDHVNYELCVIFETLSPQCISSYMSETSAPIPVVSVTVAPITVTAVPK